MSFFSAVSEWSCHCPCVARHMLLSVGAQRQWHLTKMTANKTVTDPAQISYFVISHRGFC